MPLDLASGPKIGPLTSKQWMLVVGVGGIGFYLYKKRKNKASSTATAGLTPTGSGTFADASGNIYDANGNLISQAGAGLTGAGSAFLGGGGGGTGAAPGNAGGVTGSYNTNNDWFTAAIQSLIGHGYDPLASESALSAFLSGQKLTQVQQAIVDAALRYAGAPPVDVGTVTVPIIPTPIGSGGQTKKKYTTLKGDTLASVAKKLGVSLKSLETDNPAHAKHPSAKLPAGQVLYYPSTPVTVH